MRIGGAELHIEPAVGDGDLVILVHGAWTDHATWAAAVGPIARAHTVVTYDRRGHSASERGPAAQSRRRHEDDLAELVERLGRGPAHLVGTSYGASISLSLAGRRPDLVRSIVGHEPPLLDVHPVPGVRERFAEISEQLAGGDVAGGTRAFFDDALGRGTWEILPEPLRAAAMANAQTFIDLVRAQDWAALDIEAAPRFPGPVVITYGDASPPWLPEVAIAVAERVGASSQTIEGAGHTPQITHPEALAELVEGTTGAAAVPRESGERHRLPGP
jgi:pimeloyl-ACP methyl ester carboxylesterase